MGRAASGAAFGAPADLAVDMVDAVGSGGVDCQPDCVADTQSIEGEVSVAPRLATAPAHHFNFLAPDLPISGDYVVAACFVGAALAEVISGDGAALSIAAPGKRMLAVQQVKAVKGAVFDVVD